MSALDQQVAEAREAVSKKLGFYTIAVESFAVAHDHKRPEAAHLRTHAENYRADVMRVVDALLTTHRRQVESALLAEWSAGEGLEEAVEEVERLRAKLAASEARVARMLESLRTIAHLLQNPADAGHLINGGNAFKLARDTYIAESSAIGVEKSSVKGGTP